MNLEISAVIILRFLFWQCCTNYTIYLAQSECSVVVNMPIGVKYVL